jgi:GDPmannose 4,6-dehydratase
MPRALITGVTGQDGQYLAEHLLEAGYQVFGLVAGQNNQRASVVEQAMPAVDLIGGDLQDLSSLIAALEYSQPDEVYNLGAISFVGLSFKQPDLTANVTGLGVLRMLEAVRLVGGSDRSIRFYQASSSEMFGKVTSWPQTETTPFHPRSPYAAAKVFGHHITVNYREAYDLFAVSGILFNHESPRRGLEFVTRKVTTGVARIRLGLQKELTLGNLDARRDWGFAGDYVRAMRMMLEQDEPEDYLIATGESHSVREFTQLAFKTAGIDDWEQYVRTDERFLRPAEVDHLVGDASRAHERLGWAPTVAFPELVAMMVESDLRQESAKLGISS